MEKYPNYFDYKRPDGTVDRGAYDAEVVRVANVNNAKADQRMYPQKAETPPPLTIITPDGSQAVSEGSPTVSGEDYIDGEFTVVE
jgi:hypothetical protein